MNITIQNGIESIRMELSVKGASGFIWLLGNSHYNKLFDTQSTKKLNIVAISAQTTLKTLH